MSNTYNIYCDESCHLENDHQKAMVLGAIWCPLEESKNIYKRIREIKVEHGLSPKFEIKWSKISPSQQEFYLDLVNYFFDNQNLHFRAVVIPDKKILNHKKFKQTHDEWYYKMYFDMLKVIISPTDLYNIYIDIKDTLGGQKVIKLHDFLNNNLHNFDFNRKIIQKIQIVKSDEIELIQLADLLIGALGYFHRQITTSNAKLTIINKIVERSGYPLTRKTLPRENKFNLLIWEPANHEST